MMTELIPKGFLAIVLPGEYQQVEPFADQSQLVKNWGRSYHLKKIYQQQIIHVLRKKFKSVIYVAIEVKWVLSFANKKWSTLLLFVGQTYLLIRPYFYVQVFVAFQKNKRHKSEWIRL